MRLLALALLLVAPPLGAQEFTFEEGPITGQIGNLATIEVPAGFAFVNKAGMPGFNAATGNLHSPDDVGALYPLNDSPYIVFFSFDDIGYVKDDDKDELDASGMMRAFQENEDAANKERQRRGLPSLSTVGWSREPYYDAETRNLTWGVRLRSGDSDGEVINHNIRMLGRKGVMRVIVADDPQLIDEAVADFTPLLDTFEFSDGSRYEDFRSGDKVAKYGLAGLVVGGGLLAAAKTGLLGKLGKFLKFIIIAVIAAFAAGARWIKGLFGGGSAREQPRHRT